jgi:hypothetical protein
MQKVELDITTSNNLGVTLIANLSFHFVFSYFFIVNQ